MSGSTPTPWTCDGGSGFTGVADTQPGPAVPQSAFRFDQALSKPPCSAIAA